MKDFYPENSKKNKAIMVMTGVIAGICNGLFGGGGGMIVVPMLNFALKKAPKHSHATAILVILPIAVATGMFYVMFGKFETDSGIPTCLGVVCGGIIGALILKKISNKKLTAVFSVVILLSGIKMLFF